MLTFSWNTTVRKKYFQVFPVLLHFFDYSFFEVDAQIIQELGAWRDGVLLEKLFIFNANLLYDFFKNFLFA
jgi:hypothetical protein